MGPWTNQAQQWFPQLPEIQSLKAASLVVKAELPPTVLFSAYVDEEGGCHTPELYPREDEVYMCQSAVPQPLPDDPLNVTTHPHDIASLTRFARALSDKLKLALEHESNIRAQSCNMPHTADHLPIIGPVPGTQNVVVATGHSYWGILNSPATGLAVAELLVDGQATCVDLTPFLPARF